MCMQDVVKYFIQTVMEFTGDVPFKVGSVLVSGPQDINKAVDELLGVDDMLEVYCPERKIWISVCCFNDPDEIMVDYTDNDICNAIYKMLNLYTTTLDALDKVSWFDYHNNNLTKEQYWQLEELKATIQSLKQSISFK